MSNKLNNPEIWKKSYLIEIAYTDKQAEVFTFSMPPEGSEITISQRVSETKTFGGLFVDDYGIDVAKIHLSGTTGNSCFKKIYRGTDTSETWLDGKEEIYYLRDRIIRYKDQGQSKDCPPVYLYNLGIQGRKDYKSMAGIVDAWEVILKDFKITQSKDKPFIYNYAIDFTGIRLLGTSTIRTRAEPGLNNGSIKKLNFLQKCLNAIEKWYGISQQVRGAVQNARSAVNWFTAEVERYVTMLTGSFENYIQTVVDAVGIGMDVYGSFKQITMAPADSALRMIKSLKTLRESVEAAIADMKTLPEQWEEKYGKYGKVAEATESEIEAYRRYFEETMQDTENTANDQYKRAVSSSNPIILLIFRDEHRGSQLVKDSHDNASSSGSGSDNGGDDSGSNGRTSSGNSENEDQATFPEIILVYGYMRHITNSETTLEGLAAKYLGDPDKARIIALINGITGDDEIQPGDQLKIPLLSENSLNSLNQIFGSVNIRDAYGIDIALENGILEVGHNGDFSTKLYHNNMEQAISLRLSESLGNRIRLSTYGIRNVAGVPDAVATAYLIASVKDTVLQDPRITSMEDVHFQGIGDAMQLEFVYYTYDGVRREYQRVL
jgi:nucleoid-associated protein YgaU